MALDHSRLGVQNKFLENKIRSNFFGFDKFTLQILANKKCGCVQTNLLYFFIHHIWRERVLWGTVFIIQTSYKVQYFTIFQDKLHLFYIQDHRSTRGLLAKPFKKFPKSPAWPAGSNFWQALNLQRNLEELRFNMIKNLLCLLFY